jgi:hypothetical protein
MVNNLYKNELVMNTDKFVLTEPRPGRKYPNGFRTNRTTRIGPNMPMVVIMCVESVTTQTFVITYHARQPVPHRQLPARLDTRRSLGPNRHACPPCAPLGVHHSRIKGKEMMNKESSSSFNLCLSNSIHNTLSALLYKKI